MKDEIKKITDALYDWRRRRFGRYVLDDPRPIAAESPYTFYLPSDDMKAALEVGDHVQLVIRSVPSSRHYDAERMWVTITSIDGDWFVGNLANTPFDMPQLPLGTRIEFQCYHVIDIEWSDQAENGERVTADSVRPKQIWDRCLVDKCVTDRERPVYYIYREEPDMGSADDKYPDSGWRIRGDYRGLSDEELEGWEAEFVAIGRVLNADDSWLHLIDEPVGSKFLRNFDTGEYEPEETEPNDQGL